MAGKIGVIGGSGLYDMAELDSVEMVELRTPFGDPSDAFITGQLGGRQVVFLPRHGRGHRILPSRLNFRANIFGMKQLGVEWLIAVSAVGSMQEEIAPGDVAIPDQFLDFTRGRASTFFRDGLAAHVSMADPVCPEVSAVLGKAARAMGATVHQGGTYLCIEGPQFSTRAESNVYRSWGASVIGMTNMPEAKLAREAGICYATLALVTDYDCWHEAEADVTVDTIVALLKQNAALAQQIVQETVLALPAERQCSCKDALRDAIITSPEAIPAKVKEDLQVILGKYLA